MVRGKETIDNLVQEFAREHAKQTDAIWRGDPRNGNKHAKRAWKAIEKLLAIGNPGRDALAQLFRHDSPDVRSAAAAILLRYRHDEARRVLEEVAAGKGLIAFEAQETLKRWAEGGVWQLDPE